MQAGKRWLMPGSPCDFTFPHPEIRAAAYLSLDKKFRVQPRPCAPQKGERYLRMVGNTDGESAECVWSFSVSNVAYQKYLVSYDLACQYRHNLIARACL